MPHVFISYVHENERTVQRLRRDLEKNGVDVWIDRKDILPGSRWKQAIHQAIQNGSFFIACFSPEFLNRSKTYMHEELTLAIEELRQRPSNQVWFIPVLLSECEMPDREIGGGETLSSIQHVRLYENWGVGIQQILSVTKWGAVRFISTVSERGDVKLHLELSKLGVKGLEELLSETGVSTRKDLLNNALTLFEWATTEIKKGSIICSVNERHGELRELSMPIIDYIRGREKM